MSYSVKIFDNKNPCSKLDFWNCFRNGTKTNPVFRKVPVVEAHSIIGLRAPQNWIKKGWLEKAMVKQTEMYVLTKAGHSHLKAGIVTYLNNPKHRDLVEKVKTLPKVLAEQVLA